MDKKDIKTLPNRPGIYKFLNAARAIIYVGKALSLKSRVASYFASDATDKARRLIGEADRLDYIETGSEFEALLLEARLIKEFKPKYNVVFKDDKSYLYIFVTSEIYPKILLTRKPKEFLLQEGSARALLDGIKGNYYGPFPSASTTRSVLKMLRRIFPYCQQKRIGSRACFYSHIGLCQPCPSLIVKQVEPLKSILTQEYRQNIFHIQKILDGHLGELEKTLTHDMEQCAKIYKFEDAAKIRNQLQKLHYISSAQDTTSSFLANENFYFDRQKEAIEELKQLLLPFYPNLQKPARIESYDISNFQGSSAVGAQVVFVNGIPEKSQYRKYKIKTVNGPNDFASLREMMMRRLKHTEWNLPDLVLIDGGRGQVGTIYELFKETKTTIPLIGLAKRLEKIIVSPPHFQEISLSRKTSALKLLQQIRDETHRFAISYHKKRRAKAFLNEL